MLGVARVLGTAMGGRGCGMTLSKKFISTRDIDGTVAEFGPVAGKGRFLVHLWRTTAIGLSMGQAD